MMRRSTSRKINSIIVLLILTAFFFYMFGNKADPRSTNLTARSKVVRSDAPQLKTVMFGKTSNIKVGTTTRTEIPKTFTKAIKIKRKPKKDPKKLHSRKLARKIKQMKKHKQTAQMTQTSEKPLQEPQINETTDEMTENKTTIMTTTTSTSSSTTSTTPQVMSCNIPELSLNDSSLMNFFKTLSPLKCGTEPNWVLPKRQTLELDPEIVKNHPDITCDLTYFWFKTDTEVYYSEKKTDVEFGSRLESDYFIAECSSSDGATYKNYHATVVSSVDTISRLSALEQPSNWSGLNVYMFGFDSVSHLSAQRHLPKTYNYLLKEHQMVFLDGYNIVGDGTPQALLPMFTGKTEQEMPHTQKRLKNAKYVDEAYPFIWNDFSKAGYVTQYGEDCTAVGTFTFRLKGFSKVPTDSYLRTFGLGAEKGVRDNCLGNSAHHVTFFDQAQALFEAYPQLPKFSFLFHGWLSHDDLNKIQVADADMVTHLENMKQKGFLNNTLLIFMADHGPRFGNIRAHHQGQLEERMPLLGIALPQWFREGQGRQGWDNLNINKHRLTTPFDIYPTLSAVLEWPQDQLNNFSQRSLSLWGQIPPERECGQAGIEPHWCTCLKWRNVDVKDKAVEIIGKEIIAAINAKTKEQRGNCSELELKRIERAERLAPNQDLLNYKNAKDLDGFVPDLGGNAMVEFAKYHLRMLINPNNAILEASVMFDLRKWRSAVDLKDVSLVDKGDNDQCEPKNDLFANLCLCKQER